MERRTFFRDILNVFDEEIIDILEDISENKYISGGDIIVKEGDSQRNFVFLEHGIFRGYFFDIDGQEVTDCFGYKIGTPAMSLAIAANPSPITIEAVTECRLIEISGEALIPLMDHNPMLLKIYNEILQIAMQVHSELKFIISQRSALERYQWFLETYPGLDEYVSNKHIASFLGMNQVTLSRVKREVKERGMCQVDDECE